MCKKGIKCTDLLGMTSKQVAWAIVPESNDFIDGFILGQEYSQGKIKQSTEEMRRVRCFFESQEQEDMESGGQRTLDEIIKMVVTERLKTKNKAAVAKSLNIGERTLYRYMKKWSE